MFLFFFEKKLTTLDNLFYFLQYIYELNYYSLLKNNYYENGKDDFRNINRINEFTIC